MLCDVLEIRNYEVLCFILEFCDFGGILNVHKKFINIFSFNIENTTGILIKSAVYLWIDSAVM